MAPLESTTKDKQPVNDRRRAKFINDYTLYLLARASFLVSEQFHIHLSKVGISVPFWRVLGSLADGDRLSTGELAKITLYKQPTLTKIIDRMTEMGLVSRHQCSRDRRSVLVAITPEGQDLAETLIADALEHESGVLGSFTDTEQETLKRVLRTVIDRLGGPDQHME